MPQHDPNKFVAQLSAKLSAPSRHVCFFLGAGLAKASGLPDIAGLQQKILEKLPKEQRDILDAQLKGRNLEGVLSRLRRIASLIKGAEVVDGMTSELARKLDEAICSRIVGELDVTNANLSAVGAFASWIARARYRFPLELFTVNYDLLLETALENERVPYFDGFVGALRARFIIDLVENDNSTLGDIMPSYFVRLWKLHGSVNWAREDQEVLRLGQPIKEGQAAAIYPSDEKYEESRRVPFVVLQDRFRRALNQPETIVILSGYSFADEHLNEMIFDAAARRERSEFIAFCFDDIPQELKKRALKTPNLQAVGRNEAVIAGEQANWEPTETVDARYWDGKTFLLPDFAKLSAFLSRNTAHAIPSGAAAPEAVP